MSFQILITALPILTQPPRQQILHLTSTIGLLTSSFYTSYNTNSSITANTATITYLNLQLNATYTSLLTLCKTCDVDIGACITKKIRLNNKKYPVHLCKGKHGKYTDYSDKTGITKTKGQSDYDTEDTTKPVVTNNEIKEIEELKTLLEVRTAIRAFANDREWDKFHTPRNILLALIGELGELAEIFQWMKDGEDENGDINIIDKDSTECGLEGMEDKNVEKVQQELSDVMIYLIRLADLCGCDLSIEDSAKEVPRDDSEEKEEVEVIAAASEDIDVNPEIVPQDDGEEVESAVAGDEEEEQIEQISVEESEDKDEKGAEITGEITPSCDDSASSDVPTEIVEIDVTANASTEEKGFEVPLESPRSKAKRSQVSREDFDEIICLSESPTPSPVTVTEIEIDADADAEAENDTDAVGNAPEAGEVVTEDAQAVESEDAPIAVKEDADEKALSTAPIAEEEKEKKEKLVESPTIPVPVPVPPSAPSQFSPSPSKLHLHLTSPPSSKKQTSEFIEKSFGEFSDSDCSEDEAEGDDDDDENGENGENGGGDASNEDFASFADFDLAMDAGHMEVFAPSASDGKGKSKSQLSTKAPVKVIQQAPSSPAPALAKTASDSLKPGPEKKMAYECDNDDEWDGSGDA